MGKDYIPEKDAGLVRWFAQFLDAAQNHKAEFGLTDAELAALQNGAADFADAHQYAIEAQREAASAVSRKDAARALIVGEVRRLTQRIQPAPAMTNATRREFGISLRDKTRRRTLPVAPIRLIANPNANGVNVITWQRGENAPGTVFLIEAQDGAGGDWRQVGAELGVTFSHRGQVPGAEVWYRVISQRGGRRSEPSDTTAVYPNTNQNALRRAA